MGLFDKIFSKKVCDICGGEIGLLGNRKLQDGNLCKECASKLSPWFSDRRESTVEEIRGQLAYREQNREALSAFHTTLILGRYTKVYFDEDARKFMVTGANDPMQENTDVLDFSQVVGCDFQVNDWRSEEKRKEKTPDGKSVEVSFDPPHFNYHYNFHMVINVNHPYFDRMEFDLNCGSVEIHTVGPLGENGPLLRRPPMPGPGPEQPAKRPVGALLHGIAQALQQPPRDPRLDNPEYMEYLDMGNRIKDMLMANRR